MPLPLFDNRPVVAYDPQPRFVTEPESARFDGETVEAQDQARLAGQLGRVWALMQDGQWRTLGEIASACDCSEAAASARLRDLRKSRFGGYQVDRRRVAGGLFEYRVQR